MPQVLIAAAAYAAAGGAASAVLFAGITVAQIAAVGALTVFQAVQAKRARAKARQQFNDSLRDRLQMIDLQPDAPRTLVLGRVRCVEGVRRRWATGEHDKRLTLVVSFAGHEIDAFEQFYFNDKPVELNAEGWVVTDPWLKGERKTRWVGTAFGPDGLATVVAGAPLVDGSQSAVSGQSGGDAGSAVDHPITVTGGNTMTASGPPGVAVNFTWQENVGTPKVRIRTWLGAPGQNVGAALAAEYPSKITASDRFEGMAVAVVDLDYDEDVFPQGPPNITAVIRGAKIMDPRTGVTAWSDNSALCANYYARYAQGWALPADVIRTSDVIAAANESDIETTFTVRQADDSTTTVTLPRYRCGIVVPDGSDPREAMDDIMDTMAGRWGWAGGTWRFRCGVSAAPVFALTPDWVAQRLDAQGEPVSGAVVKISNGVAREGKLNTITGSCVDSDQRWQVLPFPAVVDPVLVAREGDYPAEVSYPGVVHVAHAQHLSAIRIREAQAALRLQVSCNFSAYETELFDCGTVILPRYGMTEVFGKVAEVVGWRWHPTEGVSLQLAETSAAIYELGELNGADPAPDSSFPSPFNVPLVAGLAAESGTEQLLRSADGTLLSRIRLTWDAVGDDAVRNGGGLDVRYGPMHLDPETWAQVELRGDAVETHLTGVQDGWYYAIAIRARNSLVRGKWSRLITHRVEGKTAPPRNVPSISYEITTDGVLLSVPQNPDLDRDVTELRVSGLDWDSSVPLVGTEPTRFSGTTYLWPRPPAGIYRVRARYLDTTGNDSLADAYVDVTIGAAELIAWGSISGRPKLFRVGATGFSAAGAPIGAGLYDGETGAMLVGSGRSYAFARIRRSDGAVTYSNIYDVLSEGTDPGATAGYGRGSAALAADLNATGSESIAVVYTADEPAGNRLQNGLSLAMLRCGASRAVFASPEFQSRSAYVLIGIGGCGEGNGFESYQGAVSSDPNAWVDVSFQLASGQLIVTGSGATPRTLRDYAYTGDLNATATLRLVARNGCETSGSVARKTMDTGVWVGDVFSRDGYAGGAYAAAVADRNDRDLMFGLDRAPSESTGYYEIDAAIYLRSDGQIEVYQSGNSLGGFGAYAAGDRFMVLYDGTRLHYSRNGAVFFTFDWVHNDPLYFDSSFVQVGASISSIEFGPLSSIRRALDAANAAQTAANNAAAGANAALADLASIASDSVLARSEKSRVIQDWNVLANEQGGINAQADNYAVVGEKNAYNAAINDLAGYLSSLSPNWDDIGQDSPINGATWRYVWQQAYLTRQAMLDKIAANAKARLGALATLSQVGTPQIIDNSATVPISISGADGSGPAGVDAELVAYTFDNATGATATVEAFAGGRIQWANAFPGSYWLYIRMTATVYDGSWNNTGQGATVSSQKLQVNSSALNDEDFSSYALLSKTYVLPPGWKVVFQVATRWVRSSGSTQWRDTVLRINAILK